MVLHGKDVQGVGIISLFKKGHDPFSTSLGGKETQEKPIQMLTSFDLLLALLKYMAF